MHGRVRVALVVAALVTGSLVAARALAVPPTPEPGFIQPGQVLPSPCTPTPNNTYEQAHWKSYGSDCRRLHFAFGPILARPGQNDALIEPVTIEKPAYSGYIVRFRPDLVDETGKAPDISQVHLHHATWINGYPQYGNGPFFAAGEEKTIAIFPPGYGMHVGANDFWLLLYMVHNATEQARVVWITYDIDYIADANAAAHHIVPVKPVWLDVQHQRIAQGAPSTSANPVFNVQKGFGHPDVSSFHGIQGLNFNDGTGKIVCTWPLENCAHHDTYGNVTPQQGKPIALPGADWTVRPDLSGTLVGIGGHLHPGGIRDEVSLVRGGVEKPIFISDSVAWKHGLPPGGNIAGGPQNSWDFSMGVTGATLGWKVNIKPGDVIRLNAVYDSNDSSWYENMGIVVAMVATDTPQNRMWGGDSLHGGSGLDVFDKNVALDPHVPVTATATPGWLTPTCHPNNDASAGSLRLCLRGQVTHAHMKEASTFGGCGAGCLNLTAKISKQWVSQIVSLGFTYGNADLYMVGRTGIPKVHLNQPVTFVNFDTVGDVWHTFTRCKYPCNGTYGLDYPTANGGTGTGSSDLMDFDSTEVGYGLFFSPASGQFGGSQAPQQALKDGLFATFTPTQTGVYTLYCRIHPSMRGVFAVVG